MTPKQSLFVQEYLIDLNATQAAIRAGYSAKTAEQQGPRLLGNVGVRKAIDAAQAKRAIENQIDADWALQRMISAYQIAENEMKSNPSASMIGCALKALELVCKHVNVQAFRERFAHEGLTVVISGKDAEL